MKGCEKSYPMLLSDSQLLNHNLRKYLALDADHFYQGPPISLLFNISIIPLPLYSASFLLEWHTMHQKYHATSTDESANKSN